jgi:hypothetical protein
MFTYVFVSGIEGMRKPELRLFHRMIDNVGCLPSEILMVDNKRENISAARSLGMQGMLVSDEFAKRGCALRNLLQKPLPRAEAFMKANAGHHHCTVEGHEGVLLKDNFAQLLIWELTGDQSLIYLKWPSGKVLKHGKVMENDTDVKTGEQAQNGPKMFDRQDVNNGLWNYFYEDPILTTKEFPADADTTAIAYLSIPPPYLEEELADVRVMLDAMATNTDADGLMQMYFCAERPRTVPEVCANILRCFYRFNHSSDSDPRIRATERWVVACLRNRAYLDGSRHYPFPEVFLYFVARLYEESTGCALRTELGAMIRNRVAERVKLPANPLALAMRLAACQSLGVEPSLYSTDLVRFMSLQEEDGGWPAGHFCCIGRTGAAIGNRGLTTALAIKIIKFEDAASQREEV